MAFGRSILWGVALIGCAMISLIQGAYEVKYRCAFDSAAGSIGKFSVEFYENGVNFPAAGTFYALVDVATGALCSSALAESVTGTNPNEITTFPDQSVITASLPCGVVAVAGGATTDYTFTIVTQTLSSGFTTLDKYYTMTCDFVTTRDASITSTAVATPSVGVGAAPTELAPAITLEVHSRTDAAAFTAVAASGAVAFGDDLQIKIAFDLTNAAGVEFYVKSCFFEATNGGVTRKVDIVKAYGTKYCISADAETLGFGTVPAANPLHGFDYAIAGTDYVGTSSSFEVFSLFVKAGAASPIPMTLKCSVTYCLTGCDSAPACAGTVLTKRRRRAAEEDPKTTTVEAILTVVPQGDPRANKSQGNGSGATTDCAVMSNMGYLVGLIVLAAMLLFTVATTIFMYTRLNRRRDPQTTKA